MNKKALFRIFTVLSILIVSFSIQVLAQTSFKPENLGRNVNTPYPEYNPVLSADGEMLFFSRANHPDNTFGDRNSQDIWYSTLKEDGTWSKAKRLPESINIGRYNAILSALDDGKTYLIQGQFNRKGTRWVDSGLSLIEHKGGNNWGLPVAIDVKRMSRYNRGRYYNAFLTPDGEVLILAMTRRANNRFLRFYVSRRIAPYKYTKPQLMKGAISDARSLEAPFLTNDKNKLFFSAVYDEEMGGQNIYYAHRMDNTFRNWSVPIKATDTINSPNWDSYFKFNANESWAYYSSTTNSIGRADIFRVKIYEDNPFVKFSGLILSQEDQKLMFEDTTYRILVNDKPFKEMRIDRNSASYEVMLPLGESYTLTPDMENWNGISVSVDLTNQREYAEEKLNLFFTAVPFVLVRGTIIDTRTNAPLTLDKNPAVYIDGSPSDSIRFDRFSSAFQATLPLGERYVLSPMVPNYTGESVEVDVRDYTAFVEKNITFYVTSVPWIEISGQALDNSSFTPIVGDSNPKFLINGQVADSIQIDPVSGRFTVRLPYGAKYNLGIEADNHRTIDNAVDLTNYNEFAALRQNVYAERLDANMVTLTGKFINTKTGRQLDEGYEVIMRVNGVPAKTFAYDPENATYELRLPVGYNYDLTPRVANFYNRFEPVDLTDAQPMSQMNLDFSVTPIEVGQSIDIEHIYFETGRAVLKPESYRSLNALIEFLNEYPNVRVEIGGHTDNVGSAAINEQISQQRAEQVARYVRGQGVPANRIEAKGYGFTKPKASNRTAEGRAKNRRVDFTITGI